MLNTKFIQKEKKSDLYRRRYVLFVDGDVIPLAEI